MAADDFFARWNKRKMDATSAQVVIDSAIAPDVDNSPAVADAPAVVKLLPTLADVEGLTAESDYTAFLAKGVDESVKRCAMKKLFALPQFNIMDGLDIYVGDYSQPDPLPPGMLETLNHVKNALDPAQFFTRPVSQLLDKVEQQAPVAANLPENTELDQDAAKSECATDNSASVLAQADTQAGPQPSAVETLKDETV
ncbi:MAG: DUF3306 domain-containing protein [Glaciimonas sp.]|nr:DUF3306 domain-containing protein [Glaciimonas sp.]